MAIKYLEQKRLLYAMRATSKEGRGAKEEKSSNYDSMVKKVPAYIQKNGFPYTLAFLQEKDKEIFYDIWKWHCESELNEQHLMQSTSKNDFMKKILELEDMTLLRALTLETLAIMKCFRRFVKEEDK